MKRILIGLACGLAVAEAELTSANVQAVVDACPKLAARCKIESSTNLVGSVRCLQEVKIDSLPTACRAAVEIILAPATTSPAAPTVVTTAQVGAQAGAQAGSKGKGKGKRGNGGKGKGKGKNKNKGKGKGKRWRKKQAAARAAAEAAVEAAVEADVEAGVEVDVEADVEAGASITMPQIGVAPQVVFADPGTTLNF
jgi:hypothetical protein